MGFGQESRTTLILLNVCEVRQLSIVFFINTNGYLNLKKRERKRNIQVSIQLFVNQIY